MTGAELIKMIGKIKADVKDKWWLARELSRGRSPKCLLWKPTEKRSGREHGENKPV